MTISLLAQGRQVPTGRLYPPDLELENVHGINSRFETILKQTNTPESKTTITKKFRKKQPTTTTLK